MGLDQSYPEPWYPGSLQYYLTERWLSGEQVACVYLYLRESLFILDLAGPEQSEHIFGPLRHGMLHPVMMSELFDTKLHPAQVLVT